MWYLSTHTVTTISHAVAVTQKHNFEPTTLVIEKWAKPYCNGFKNMISVGVATFAINYFHRMFC